MEEAVAGLLVMEDEDRIADKSDLEIKLVPNLVPPRGGDSVCNDVWLASVFSGC